MFTKEVFVQKTRRWENNIYYKMAKSYSMSGKILYAEDDFLTREIVGEKLEEEGYAVVLAKDGKEAWNEFQQNVFDAVILDVDIPVYNGYEVASLIQSENLQIPLIFYSSLTADGFRRTDIPVFIYPLIRLAVLSLLLLLVMLKPFRQKLDATFYGTDL